MLSSKAGAEILFLILVIAIVTLAVFYILYLTVFKVYRLSMCKESQIKEYLKIRDMTVKLQEREVGGFEEETFEIKGCVEKIGFNTDKEILEILYEDAKNSEEYPTNATWVIPENWKQENYNATINSTHVVLSKS
jgi:predicted Holliday junction resolvase-like endonuclease